jgi:hypothetical protein
MQVNTMPVNRWKQETVAHATNSSPVYIKVISTDVQVQESYSRLASRPGSMLNLSLQASFSSSIAYWK